MNGKPILVARRFLARPDLALYLALLAVLVCSPALNLGWVADDLVHQASILGVDEFPDLKKSPLAAFRFASGEAAENHRAIDAGIWPWWSAEGLRLNFLRPISGLTHGIDYALWPRSPVLMHAHSLLWLAAAVVIATRLYRRLLPRPAVAGLAALLFALDEVHGMAASWIANRNALVAAVFVLLALVAYDRLRRDDWRPGIVWTPLLLLLGLLANEGAVAGGAYLLAYALCLDHGAWKQRLLPLVPSTALGAVWWLAYKLLGYGTSGSGIYIDPGTDPARFFQVATERAPALLRGLLAWPPADLDILLAQSAQPISRWLSLALMLFFAALFGFFLRHDPRARFFAVGTLLSLAPACATFPSNRLLILAGFGGMGFLALLLAALWNATRHGGRSRLPARATVVALLVIHTVMAPLSILAEMNQMKQLGSIIDRAAASLPSDEAVSTQRVVIINTPTAFVSNFAPVIQALRGARVPASSLLLGSSLYPITIERRDEHTLAIRPEAGFLAPPGTPRPGDETPPLVFPGYAFQMLDHLFRDVHTDPLEVAEQIELTDLTIEITAIEDGRPAEATFRFVQPLEDPALRWLVWQEGVFIPFELPAPGETVVLEPARIQ